jgi:hypothetical protein
MLALSNRPNRVEDPCPTPEDRKYPAPEMLCFKKYWIMDKFQKFNNPN